MIDVTKYQPEYIGTDQYGLNYAKYIANEWDIGKPNGRFAKRKAEFSELINYRNGDIDVSKYADVVGLDKDASNQAIEWPNVSVLPKYIDVVTYGFNYEMYDVKVKSIDSYSLQDKTRYREEKEMAMYTRGYTEDMYNATGVDMRPQGFVPDSKEELDLHMQLEWKPNREIATELGVKKLFEFNNIDEIQEKVIGDLTLLGFGGIRHFYDNMMGLKIRKCDPANTVYSNIPSNKGSQEDIFYAGEVVYKTIGQIERETNRFGTEQLKEIANGYRGQYSNPQHVDNDNLRDFLVMVLDFAHKEVEERVYKKKYYRKGGFRYIDKTQEMKGKVIKYDEGRKPEFEWVTDKYEVWYEGFHIIGSEYVYNYRKMEYMARPYSNIQKAISPFLIYEIEGQSIGSRIKYFANQIYITIIKLQQLIANLRPKGVAIDYDALMEMDLGGGELMKPINQVKMFFEKGSYIFSSKGLDGDFSTNRPPIYDLPQGTDQNIGQLIGAYNHYIAQIEGVTGINRYRDGSTPNPDTLVKVQENAIQMSNNATRHILRGDMYLMERLSEAAFTRLQDMSYDKNIYEGLKSAIGEENMDALEELSHLHLYMFTSHIEMKPSQEEKMELRESINIALKAGLIDITDKIDIEQIDNIKLASQVLKMRKKKREEKAIALQREQRAAEQQAEQRKYQMEMQKEALKARLERQSAREKAMLDIKGKVIEKKWDAFIARLEAKIGQGKIQSEQEFRRELENFKQNRMDGRVDKQSTHESAKIEQRDGVKGQQDFSAADTGNPANNMMQ